MTENTELDNAMKNLNAQWYNAIVEACHLDQNKFQLYQGNKPLGNTSDTLWSIFDSIPPKSIAHLYDPSQANNFSTGYANVLTVMESKGLSNLQSVLSDDYMDFMGAWNVAPSEFDMETFFKRWSSKNCPDKTGGGLRAILAAEQDPLVAGLKMWNAAGGFGGAPKAYTTTIDMVRDKMPAAAGAKVNLNSKTTSSDVSHTWAKGSISSRSIFFSASANTKYDKLAQKYISTGLTSEITFDHVQTVATGPMYQKNTSDPTLSKYEPWYLSSILSDAYNTKDNTVWITGKTPNWDTAFGDGGSMLRRVSAVIVVDGISMTMTSKASFSKSESESFNAAAQEGFWPFFRGHAPGGWSNTQSFNDAGEITVESNCPAGNPTIVGILQTPAPDYIIG